MDKKKEGNKILIVEDDESLSSMYKMKLETDGFIVFIAVNGLEGIEIAKKEKPDLILMDVIMPQIDGFTALAELKKTVGTKNIPVIMSTNLGTDEDVAKGKALGAVDYIVKANLTPSQVSEKIKEHL